LGSGRRRVLCGALRAQPESLTPSTSWLLNA
jgi:hypothetical protein